MTKHEFYNAVKDELVFLGHAMLLSWNDYAICNSFYSFGQTKYQVQKCAEAIVRNRIGEND